jgi:hypothetical protein
MSPTIEVTPAGSAASRWPRLNTETLCPAATASSTQGSEICPVPPTNSTLSDMFFSS